VIKPFTGGEGAWRDVLSAIVAAKESIHMAFWMMHLDHELDRTLSLEFKDPSDRQANTLHDILIKKTQEGVRVRILLWILPTIPSTEKELLELLDPIASIGGFLTAAAAPSVLATLDLRILKYAILRKFDVLLEPHPTHPLGSWHQKTIIVDDQIAFVGGMNAKENDWDRPFHRVFDYNRMPHSSTGAERRKLEKKRKLAEYPPRHDFMARIEGPLVTDVQNNFISRWNQAITDKRFFSRNQVKLFRRTLTAKGSGGKSGQIVRTMPAYPPTPMGEKGCLEMYQKAIRNAEKYIYIEDQYFRSQTIAQELANAYVKNPKLIIIVVTPPDSLAEIEWINIGFATPSTFWTADAFKTIAKVIPDFCLFRLMANDTNASGEELYVNIDTHAKLMIVDDEWYTIGSCNINERGFLFEGEINISVNDADAFMMRKVLWTLHMKTFCPDDIVDATKLWYEHAKKNQAAKQDKKKPVSNIYPFAQNGPLLPVVPKTWF